MKKLVVSILLFTGLILLFQSCKSVDNNKLFKIDRQWSYEVTNIDKNGNLKDSLTLKLIVLDSWWYENLVSQTRIEWRYIKSDSIIQSSLTGVSDKKDSHSTSIHPPRGLFLSFTEILPFPSSGNPGYMIYESNSSLVIEKYEDYRNGILEGKTIERHLKAVDTLSYNFNSKEYSVWVMEGENTNYIEELGQFRCKYLFNEELGFVNMQYYKPDSSIVELKLKSINY